MWCLDSTNKQTILSQYDNREICNILDNIYSNFGSLSKKKYERKDPIGIECNMKEVLCSADKSSFIWAYKSRSSAEQFGQTERSVGHYSTHFAI